MILRTASDKDCKSILAIYEQYIATPITFETELPSHAVFAERMRAVQAVYPWLVSEEDGIITGYAYAHCPWERAAYQWNAELSVYLDKNHTGKGLGTRLYKAMLGLLKMQNVRTALACVTVPNKASEGLHASLGFAQAAFFASSGYKNGAWHDVAWFSLPLEEGAGAPGQLVPFHKLPSAIVESILESQAR